MKTTKEIRRELNAIRSIIYTNLSEANARLDMLYDMYSNVPSAFTEENVDFMFMLIQKASDIQMTRDIIDELVENFA